MKRVVGPGDLVIVQAFINTIDLESGQDTLSDPAALGAWLRERGLLGLDATLEEADLVRARDLREALRALLAAHHGEPVDAAAVATLTHFGETAPLRVTFAADGATTLTSAVGGLDAAVARLLAIVFAAQVDGRWGYLKVCRSSSCRWAFYDSSKNHSGAWCNMRICGNRAKVRAYQRRRRGARAVRAG